jgi:hypothetical protein
MSMSAQVLAATSDVSSQSSSTNKEKKQNWAGFRESEESSTIRGLTIFNTISLGSVLRVFEVFLLA